ncbi:putative membrane protein [Luteimonas sp. J16]|uniref:DUF2339 domain-containing protein n=1 Tax=unclassified Luteimonas TaxID=2629088 RepID=UPI00047EC0B4|nr:MULTISPECIES: DUF2339 domain-containing protein [unclassified Luteimonas]TWG94331.1 putative membrane protein [Luteimonas sp. J16]
MEGLLTLLALAVLAMPVLLVVALVSVAALRRRVRELEDAVARLRAGTADAAAPSPQREAVPLSATGRGTVRHATGAASGISAPFQVEPGAAPGPGPHVPPQEAGPAVPPPLPPRATADQGAAAAAARAAGADNQAQAASPRRSPHAGAAADGGGSFLRAVRRWVTVGNVPVKVGMLVLLAGVAALLKYASDQGWLRMPVELRLAGVALAAIAGLAFGWRQRQARPAFALALQGGAIGVLLLVVFAAFKVYGLLPATAAFGLSIALVAGLCVLAVLQDSRSMAGLGIVAGFLAPIWLSTGSGNHVALFSYYAVLNAAIVAIAWVRSWRLLNLLGFVFTWGIGIAWGVLAYAPEYRDTTQPFLALFFAFYLLLPILFARRQPEGRRDMIDGCLLFGTPLVAFSLQAALLEGERMPLAWCALGLAALYAVLAWLLRRREGYRLLSDAHALLAAGFATLAVPLALSAQATASVFALEGAGLVWLGLRQRRRLPQVAGAALQLAAGVFHLLARDEALDGFVRPLLNPGFMGMLLIALAGFASAWTSRAAGASRIALAYYLWGLCWWGANLALEIDAFVPPGAALAAGFAALVLSGWLAAEAHRVRPARVLSATVLVAMLAAVPFALAQAGEHGHPFAGAGAWAWLAFAVLGLRSLACLRDDDALADWAQFGWWLGWPLAVSLSLAWLADRQGFGEGWELAALVLPWIVLFVLSQRHWPVLRSPRGGDLDPLRPVLQALVAVALALWWFASQFAAGSAAPLPWVAVLNPLELVQVGLLALLAHWLWSARAARLEGTRAGLLAAAGFLLATTLTLRSVHHWGGVAWDAGLASSALAQASLTVVWSLLGVAGWISGSRRGQRLLWLAGAVLMGVVLAKLVLVDRQHLGDLFGIGSFIAYGLLCTLVGYLAPAPPRSTTREGAMA